MSENLMKAIIHEVCQAIRKLGGRSDILSIVGSWNDTLEDEEILSMLKDWNADADEGGAYYEALKKIRADLPAEDPGPSCDRWGYFLKDGNQEDVAYSVRDEALWKVAEKIDAALDGKSGVAIADHLTEEQARLIAVAPALLAALKLQLAYEAAPSGPGRPSWMELVKVRDAALRLAKGDQTNG